MKRSIKAVIALLLLLLATYLGTSPAQAAKSEVAKTKTVIAYRGYTLSWSKPDASDLTVTRTRGHAESFPAKSSNRAIAHAKARVLSAASQSTTQSTTDSCTAVPDMFGRADFGRACAAHDVCYSRPSTTDRLQCDQQLLLGLILACNHGYPASADTPLRLTCYTVAGIYYVGVRLFGGFFYMGSGSRA
jgi:hypothetical protein